MPAFHYQAVDANGREQHGVMEADSEREVRQLLRDKSLVPLNVRPNAAKRTKKNVFANMGKGNGLTAKALSLFTRQFATLLAAGLPIESALQAVAEQSEKERVKGLILAVRSKVVEGHSLHNALAEHPQAFSSLYTATVAAGEKSGHLDKVLLRLADYTEQQWQMRQKLKTAMIYPAMIVMVAIGIVGFLLAYVVPKMIAVYGNLHQSLPGVTQVLIAISAFVKSFGLLSILFLILCFILFRFALKKHLAFKIKMHQVMLRAPLLGFAAKTADTARFARTLSILSASGVPVLEAMNIASKLIINIPIRHAVEKAVKSVREGALLHLSLKKTNYFSPMSVHMIASGEASGELDNMLERVARNQEEDITRMIEVGLALFEPAIILVMGGVVLFIVLAILLPIFQLNQFAG